LVKNDQARVRELVETAGREKVDYEIDYRLVHPGGEIRDIHTIGHPVFSPSGDLFEFVGTVMDVTERKRAEEALRRAQAELTHVTRIFTDSSPGLPTEGLTVTCDRQRALAREDVQFLTWDHPLVTGAIDMLLGSEQGNCSFAKRPDAKLRAYI
jgi:hypothetical protein